MTAAISFYLISFFIGLLSPVAGLIGLVCSLLIRFQDRVPEIAAYRPFTFLLIGLVISCFIHKDKLSRLKWKQDKLLLYMLLVSMVGLVLLSPGDLISETIQFISSIALYYFASRLIREKHHFFLVFVAMAICILYLANEAIVSVAANPLNSIHLDPRTIEINDQGVANGRWQGIGYYANANEFGQLMIATIPFLCAIVLIRKSVLYSIAAIAAIVVMVFVVGKTGSRTVMVILGSIFVLTFALRGNGKIIRKTVISGIAGLVLLIGLSYVPGPIQDRLDSIFSAGSDSSFQGRVRAWGYGFDMVGWYPFTGVGKGQWYEYHGTAAHNSYIQIMAELGPVGIYLFIWILILSYKEMIPFLIPGGKDPPFEIDNVTRTLAIAVCVTFTAWLIYIFLGNQSYAVWTYFYIGLCAGLRNLSRNLQDTSSPKIENSSIQGNLGQIP